MMKPKETSSSGSIQAVIFDLDGLMVDSETRAREVWNRVLGTYGYRMDDEIYGRIVGRRTVESAGIVKDAFNLPASAEKLVDQKTQLWEAEWTQGLPAMPGLDQLEMALTQREVPWAVATSSPYRYAEHVLLTLGVLDRCQAIAAGDEVNHGKPAPDIYLLAAERLGIPAVHCLALEDSVPGGRAAKAAGMTLVAIPNGTTTATDFTFADYVSSSLAEVAEHLDEILSGTEPKVV